MRTIISRFTLLSFLLLASVPGLANPPAPANPPPAGSDPLLIPVPAAPALAPPSYLLIDFRSGKVLAEKNPDQRLEPASLTKLMTAHIVFHELRSGNLKLDDEVTISEKAWRAEGSRTFVEVGKRIPVEILIKGLIIQSGNDASIALAEHIAGNEQTFAQLMNQYARRLGMTASNFVNATGLPHKDHYTTARDMAILARATIEQFPDYYVWHAEKQFSFNGITQYNRNKLLWRDDSVDGMKTGHTNAAGYCLVASAQRDDMRLISVILGSKSEKTRTEETQALLNYGFRFFETHRLYTANDALTKPKVWKGATTSLPLAVANDIWVTIPRGRYAQLEAAMTVENRIIAPVEAGRELGRVVVRLGGETLRDVPLIAAQAVEQGSWWRRLIDTILLWFK